jgi:predicted kinase
MIVSASPDARDSFVERLIETKGAVLSIGKVRGLLQGRVPEDQMEARAQELLDAAVQKRLGAGETVVIPLQGLDPDERERFVRMAAGFKRPRHLVLIETARDQVQEEDRGALNELRRRLDAGELGQEGFQTALRLGGGSVSELKRLVFRPAPRDD